MKPENHYLSVKAHLNTSNIYTQKNIVNDNIKMLKHHLNYLKGQTAHKSEIFNTQEVLRAQKIYLKRINRTISETEQGAFQFGAPC